MLPIRDDLEGALRSASAAADGFRQRGVPFLAWAVFTVGLLELTLGRLDEARTNLTEARDLGDRLENHWLQTAARTQLTALAVREGRLDEARASLAEVVDPAAAMDLSTQGLTFALVAYARLVLAEGDARQAATAVGAADALRERAGMPAWPSMRRAESGARQPDRAATRCDGRGRRPCGRVEAHQSRRHRADP